MREVLVFCGDRETEEFLGSSGGGGEYGAERKSCSATAERRRKGVLARGKIQVRFGLQRMARQALWVACG